MRRLMKITESYTGIGDEDRDYHEEEIQRFYDMGKRDLWVLYNNTVEENNPEDHDALQYMEDALKRYDIAIAEDYRDDPNRPGWKDDAGNWNKYEDCPTCNGWGEYIPPGAEQDLDNVVACPDCADDLGPAAQGKSKIIKQMGDEADAGWTVKDFPLSEDKNVCGVCDKEFKWVGNPDDTMCPSCTEEYEQLDEDMGSDYRLAEIIELGGIVESVLQEFEGQPKDYEMSDDEVGAAADVETEKEFEKDRIDPEIEDEELGLRFD